MIRSLQTGQSPQTSAGEYRIELDVEHARLIPSVSFRS